MGASEKTIGSAISNLIEKNAISRSEIVVCSKAGFIFDSNESFPQMKFIKNNNYHCIHPEFLDAQLNQSLERLNLQTLDILLLNNPERLLQANDQSVTVDTLYQMIEKAFEYLESQVENGRIGGYGVASNSISIPTALDHLSITKLFKSSKFSNFTTVQYPFNLFERHAIQQGFDGTPSLAEICDEYQLFQMTQRPFLSITRDGVRKLTTSSSNKSEQDINENATKQFELLISIVEEEDYDDMSLPAKFVVAQVLGENIGRLVENKMAAQLFFNRDIKPVLNTDLNYLIKCSETDDSRVGQEFILDWVANYRKETLKLMDCILEIADWHLDRSNIQLNDNVSLNAYKASLATNSLGICLSASNPDTTSVLVGIRSQTQLDHAIQTAKLPLLDEDQIERLFDNPMLM
ncbi:hypothetical protein HDV02_005051 [Globomyces sp. JEL0801]|nr:hypothetical protein HDV02_005051 [Globomyces sp. JEL0801]